MSHMAPEESGAFLFFAKKKRPPGVLGGGPTMLDDMFTCRGGEDLGRGTLDVRCESGVGR